METPVTHWYAIRTRHDFRAAELLARRCPEVYFPIEQRPDPSGVMRDRAVIPHVLFFRATARQALDLERLSLSDTDPLPSFWIYRYTRGDRIRPIPPDQMRLLRLLTAPDTERCEIFTKRDFTPGETVRVTGGLYKGYTGTVQRVRKNRHVVVEIEGLCLVMLPYIHPDLLAPAP